MVFKGCGEHRASEVERPWWERPYVVYGIAHPRVKARLERLINTSVVRATDKHFMTKLESRIREDHEERMRLQIKHREHVEVEREKRLILEGREKVEEAPLELALNHPVFKINKLAKKIIEDIRRKEKMNKPAKKIKIFNYDFLKGMEEEKSDDKEMKSCIRGFTEEAGKDVADTVNELQNYFEGSNEIPDNVYLRIKYEDPLVEELMELEEVDDLYDVADEVVGPLIGKKCGGLASQLTQALHVSIIKFSPSS